MEHGYQNLTFLSHGQLSKAIPNLKACARGKCTLYETRTLVNVAFNIFSVMPHARIQRGTGGLDPPERLQRLWFLSNTAPDPLKTHMATKPAFNVGPSSAR